MTAGWDRWRHLDPRTPVIVGVGRAGQHLDEPGAGLDPIALMVAACLSAGADSGAPELLRDVRQVAVPEGSWRYRNAAGLVARAVGAPAARTVVLAAGIPQQTLLNDAYRELLSGRIDVALVAGGEAARRAASARHAGVTLVDDHEREDDRDPDEMRRPEGEIVSPAEIAARVFAPAEQFALIDSALRHAEHQSIDAHRDAIARLWSGFSHVAARNPHAAFRTPKSPADIRDTTPDNRAIAFPYNKWHCSQMNVDQAAALLVSTLSRAEHAGADPARIVFPLVALESSFSLPVPRRRELHRWPAMEVLGAAAAEHLGVPITAIDHVEVYSCFPAAVRVQQRALGLPLDGVPTITGGEPFSGGPWNNFVLQATVAMIELVRGGRSRGMVTTVSGFLNKPGLAVYGTEPGRRPLLLADLCAAAEAATATVAVVDDHRGPATIVAGTVAYDRSGAVRSIVIADTPGGDRCVATSDGANVADLITTSGLIGVEVIVAGTQFHI